MLQPAHDYAAVFNAGLHILFNTTIHQPALLQVKIRHPLQWRLGIVLNLVKVSSIDTVNIDIWYCITHLKQCCLAPGVRI